MASKIGPKRRTKNDTEIQKLTAIWGAKNRYYWGLGASWEPVLLSCRGFSVSNPWRITSSLLLESIHIISCFIILLTQLGKCHVLLTQLGTRAFKQRCPVNALFSQRKYAGCDKRVAFITFSTLTILRQSINNNRDHKIRVTQSQGGLAVG